MTVNNRSTGKRIEFISDPAQVNMADDWFEIATMEHFWIRRRFEVARRLLDGCEVNDWRVGEVGCGHGLVQRQFEQDFGIAVDGFDLNRTSLERNVSTRGRLLYYNVFDRRVEFGSQYNLVVLFDVLEHIEEEADFLDAVGFLAKPKGYLLVNVPAMQTLFSEYDRSAGHVRRYSLRELIRAVSAQGFQICASTYWGLPLIPFLFVRQQHLRFRPSKNVIRRGFDPGSSFINQGMYLISRQEVIPQRLCGTSAMLLARKVT
jgi:2-polyprenyl-3-methyl-5-hydroxy-6-metoxy-1,4-benzoquinol methylase